MVHDGAGVRLTIEREAAEQVSRVTCGIRLSGRAKNLAVAIQERGRSELGVRKSFVESDPVVVNDLEDLLPLPDSNVSTATKSHIPSNNARTESCRAFSARHFPCCLMAVNGQH